MVESKIRDNRGITNNPAYVDLLQISRALEKSLQIRKYNRGERKRLENALMDIELVKELME
jgi:hypothetical protein